MQQFHFFGMYGLDHEKGYCACPEYVTYGYIHFYDCTYLQRIADRVLDIRGPEGCGQNETIPEKDEAFLQVFCEGVPDLHSLIWRIISPNFPTETLLRLHSRWWSRTQNIFTDMLVHAVITEDLIRKTIETGSVLPLKMSIIKSAIKGAFKAQVLPRNKGYYCSFRFVNGNLISIDYDNRKQLWLNEESFNSLWLIAHAIPGIDVIHRIKNVLCDDIFAKFSNNWTGFES